jgi:hypothetical protein
MENTTVPEAPLPGVTQFGRPRSSAGRICQLEIGGLPVQVQPRGEEDNDAAVRLANYLLSVTPPGAGDATSDVDRERMMNLELRDALVAGRKAHALLSARVSLAFAALTQWAGHDGDGHKAFALDQVARALTGCPVDERGVSTETTAEYASFVAAYEDGDEGARTYEWSTGVAP